MAALIYLAAWSLEWLLSFGSEFHLESYMGSIDYNFGAMPVTMIGDTGMILGLRPANERRRYFVTTSLIGWAQA